MKTCPTCRQLIPDTALYCPDDGTSLASVENDPLLGTVIAERYLLQQRVGEGRSGIIYRAEHVALRSRLALKLLHHQLSRDDAAIERFREEATRLAQIDCDNIVRVSDFGRAADDRLFFAMEFLDGETLAAALGRNGKLMPEQALELLEQVGDALVDAHALEIVHGDLRPRNIFLIRKKKRRVVKLLDFGLAKLASTAGSSPDGRSAAMADPRYMSPEQARGGPATKQSDTYSLAIIAYEMLAGAPPFGGSGTFDVLTKHLEARPVPLATKAPGVPAAMNDAIARGLSKKPEDRYDSVERFIAALRGAGAAEQDAIGAGSDHDIGGDEARRTVLGREAPSAIELTRTTSPIDPATRRRGASAQVDKAGEAQAAMASTAAPRLAAGEIDSAAPAATSNACSEPSPVVVDNDAVLVPPEEPAAVASTASQTPDGEAAEGAVTAVPTDAAAGSDRGGVAAKTILGMGISATDVMRAAQQEVTDGSGNEPFVLSRGDQPVDHNAKTVISGVTASAVAAAAAASRTDPDQATGPQSAAQGVERKSPTRPPGNEDAFSEADALGSRSMNWFAEGVAAERELEQRTRSGPLPAIYGDDDDELPKRSLSPSLIIVGVVVLAAISLGVFLLLNRDSTPPMPKPLARMVASPDAADIPHADVGADAAALSTAATDAAAVAAAEAAAPEPQAAAPAEPAARDSEPMLAQPGEPLAAAVPPKAVKEPPAVAPRKRPPEVAPKREPPRRTKPVAQPPRHKPEPKAAARRDPAAARQHVGRGRGLLQQGAYAGAKTEFKRAIELDQNMASAHAGLGEVAFEEGLYASAAKHLRVAVRLQEMNARYQTMLGHAYFRLHQTRRAIAQYRQALKVSPQSAEARAGLQAAVRRLAGR